MTAKRAEKIVCRRCGAICNDIEPNGSPEFWHPENDKCSLSNSAIHAGKRDRYGNYKIPSDFDIFTRKRDRRASKRGARKASKLRPRK